MSRTGYRAFIPIVLLAFAGIIDTGCETMGFRSWQAVAYWEWDFGGRK